MLIVGLHLADISVYFFLFPTTRCNADGKAAFFFLRKGPDWPFSPKNINIKPGIEATTLGDLTRGRVILGIRGNSSTQGT